MLLLLLKTVLMLYTLAQYCFMVLEGMNPGKIKLIDKFFSFEEVAHFL